METFLSKSLLLIDELRAGRNVTVVQCGNSMRPLISDGDSVTLKPVASLAQLQPGEVVYCRPDRKCLLGIVGAARSDRVQIIDYTGRKLGWATLPHVYGRTELISGR